MNFEKNLEIDKFALDDELLLQAILYLKWSEAKAQAEMERDKSKEQLDLVKAKLDISIRKNPGIFGLEKITEGAISNIILVQDEYQQAEIAYLEYRYSHNVISGALEALNHKKSALENLVKLFLNNYWADGRMDKEAEKLIEQASIKAEIENLNKSERLLKRSREKK